MKFAAVLAALLLAGFARAEETATSSAEAVSSNGRVHLAIEGVRFEIRAAGKPAARGELTEWYGLYEAAVSDDGKNFALVDIYSGVHVLRADGAKVSFISGDKLLALTNEAPVEGFSCEGPVPRWTGAGKKLLLGLTSDSFMVRVGEKGTAILAFDDGRIIQSSHRPITPQVIVYRSRSFLGLWWPLMVLGSVCAWFGTVQIAKILADRRA